jgi:hypothetical protein
MLAYQGSGEKIYKAVLKHLISLHNSPLVSEFLDYYAKELKPYKHNILHRRTPGDPNPESTRTKQDRVSMGYPTVASGTGTGTGTGTGEGEEAAANGAAVSQPSAGKKKDKPPAPPPYRQFTDEFCREWERSHGATYPFQAKDGVAAAKIWKYAQGDIGVAMDIVIRYLIEPGDFYAGHPLTKLAADLPRFAAADPDGIGDPNRGDGGRNATPAEIAMLQEAGLSPKEPPA